MKHRWLAYALVVLISVAAGVAIAGVPSSEAVDPTIIPPETTLAPPPTAAPTTVPEPVVTDPPVTTTTAVPAEATTTTTPPLPERSEIDVVVANGAGVGGLATSTADLLETLGYVDVRATDGIEVVDETVVYFSDGFEAAAARLAVDLELQPDAIAPIILAPEVSGEFGDAELLAYLGADQA